MAEILLTSLEDALGGPLPADAVLTATATKARSEGQDVIANRPITIPLKSGVPEHPIELDASGVDWCWHLVLVFPELCIRIDRYVAIPPTDVEWADLVDIDPDTLVPSTGSVPAWEAAVSQVSAMLIEAELAKDIAVSSANAAALSKTGADTAKTAAEAARDLALAGQFAGAALGTVDLNTIITPGVYRQGATGDATLVRNYPVATFQGVLEVFHSTATSTIFQRYMQTTGIASGKGHWQRRYTSASWSAWAFIPTQRVDQTAGRAIYTWDDVNNREQLIYGDTGWREVVSLGGMAARPGLTMLLRRVGSLVQVQISETVNGTAGNHNVYLLPAGFRAVGITAGSAVNAQTGAATTGTVAVEGTGLMVFLFNAPVGRMAGAITYTTTQPWPTTLPGVAAGSIPNA